MAFDSNTSIITRMPSIRGNIGDWNASITIAKPILVSRWYDVIAQMPTIKASMNDWQLNYIVTKPTFDISVFVDTAYTVNITAKMPQITGAFVNNVDYTFAYTSKMPVFVCTVENPKTYTSDIVAFKPIITGSFASENSFTFSKRIPFPILDFQATFISNLDSILPESYVKDTWTMNTITTAHSRYTNYNFNSYFKLGSENYGIGTDGNIYKFGYDYDNGVQIDAQVDLPISNFGEPNLKSCSDAFIFSRRDGDIEINFVVDEQQAREGLYINFDDKSGIHRKRVKIPKGMRGSVWQYKLKNVCGSDFSINSFEVFVKTLQRLI